MGAEVIEVAGIFFMLFGAFAAGVLLGTALFWGGRWLGRRFK